MHFQRVNLNFMCTCEYQHACLCITFMPGALEGEKRTLGLWGWNQRQLWATVWVLGTEWEFSARAVSTLHCWAISPVSNCVVCADCSTAATELRRWEMLTLGPREPRWCQRSYFKWFPFIFLFKIKLKLKLKCTYIIFFFSFLLQSLSCIHFHALSQM